MQISVTILVIAVTALVSIPAFSNQKMIDDLIFYPAQMKGGKGLHRFLTHGFIHADLFHLLFNMITLYFFGEFMERFFVTITGSSLIYLVFYFSAIVFASLPDYFKYRNNYSYRSLGASGGVSAVLFATILFMPWEKIYVWFIPVPAIVFAVLYVVYSMYMNKRGGDNINHAAHLWGALYGVVFTLILEPRVLTIFLNQLKNPSF